jgi:hypothetical protein
MEVCTGVLGRRLPLRLMGVFGLFLFLTLYASMNLPYFPLGAQRSSISAVNGSADAIAHLAAQPDPDRN